MKTQKLVVVYGKTVSVLLAIVMLIFGLGVSPSESKQQSVDLKGIVDAYAGSAVAEGFAIGVAVAVVQKHKEPQFFSYGLANFENRLPVTRNTIFQLGSVTKIFTTALLGEQVARKMLSLDQPLSDFSAQLGTLKKLTSEVTLKQLGDFTGGFRTYPPTHDECNKVPGALPDNNKRPTICEYMAEDLVIYFQNVEPSNDWTSCNPEAKKTPANYNYSDISTGLIGLLLGGHHQAPLSNQALEGWYELVNQKFKCPLGMYDTILYSTADGNCEVPYAKANFSQKARLAAGYEQALATAFADETTGQIKPEIKVNSKGAGYQGTTPRVTILGGGGFGAKAQATVTGDSVSMIEAVQPGSGYLNPPTVTISGGDQPPNTPPAKAAAIISKGKVVAIRILNGGSGYKSAPTATISGGYRGPRAKSAVLGKVYISNGSVYFISVTDGGRGYVDPLVVKVEPGEPAVNSIPIWAPAGSLWSTTRDMIKLVQVALGDTYVDGRKVDKYLVQGFQIAQQSYACSTPNHPCLEGSGLAWAITPSDEANGGLPEVISKNGGISGASTEVRLVPAEGLGVVVLANSRESDLDDSGQPTAIAANISDNILAAIVRSNGSHGKCR